MDAAYTAPPELGRVQQRALIAGVVFLVLLGAGAIFQPAQFFHSYLVAFVFWTGVALGCMAILMLQHLTGGAWGLVIRRVLESASRTIPLMLILFIPLAIGMSYLYEWIHPDHLQDAERKVIEGKAPYLNVTFFLIRAAVYFTIWIVLSYFLNKWSVEQDQTADRSLLRRFRMLSGPGIVLFVLTTTFAAIDWVMSLDATWSSTIFGLIFVASWALSGFAFMIAVMAVLVNRRPLAGVVAPAHFHDLGKLLLAFVMLWAYFDFSQFLIIWSGNLPEEARWYLHRMYGFWGFIALAVIILHFALPFVMLLSRDLKRSARLLAIVAGLVFIMRFIDLFWLIEPEFYRRGFHIRWMWMDVAAWIGVGGVWLWFFTSQLKRRPLLPLNDPQLEEVLERGRHHH